MIPCCAYIRVSGQSQADRDGPQRQRDTIAKYAAAHDLEIVAEYSDLGISGKTELHNRPGLAALLAHVEANGVKTVIVERADRLARDLIVSELLREQFRKRDARIISADGNVDLTADDSDPTAKLIRRLLAALADWDREIICLKMAAAKVRIRAAGGRAEGELPYGDKPGESPTLARIIALRGQGMSQTGIAQLLNTEHLPARKGGLWTRQRIGEILKREAKRAATG